MGENKLPTKVVVDSSVILSILLPDEATPPKLRKHIKAFESHKIVFIAPDLLVLEVSNALKSAFLRKRITKKESINLFDKFLKFGIIFSKTSDYKKLLKLSFKYDLSSYDATYLNLSINKKLPLLTNDKAIIKAIKRAIY